MAAHFDRELDRIIAALDNPTRRDVMAFYVTATTSPVTIGDTLKLEHSTLAYHTQVLLEAGGITPAGYLGPNQCYSATEVGLMAYVKVTGDAE
jgi:DNA-binding transcriptional ArsR family regulator